MTDVVKNFEELLEARKSADEQLKKNAREAFRAASEKIFDEHGDKVGGFGWTQYTPYFNDGEPCEFGVNDLYVVTPEDLPKLRYHNEISEEDQSEVFSNYGYDETKPKWPMSRVIYRNRHDGRLSGSDWMSEDENWEAIENPDFQPGYGDAYEAVVSLREMIPEDLLRAMFGDHVSVAVFSDRVEVNDYEHE